MAERSSGELWTEDEEELLRHKYLDLVSEMSGRSEAAVFARIERIRTHNRDWPEKPLSRLSRDPRV